MGCIQSTAVATDPRGKPRVRHDVMAADDLSARRRRSSDAGLAPDAGNAAELQRGLGSSQLYPGRMARPRAAVSSVFDVFDDMEHPSEEEVDPVDREALPTVRAVTGQGHSSRGVVFGRHSLRGRRPQQEDRFCCTWDAASGNSFFAVFDGHGGTRSAALLARILHRALFQAMAAQPSSPVSDVVASTWAQVDQGLCARVTDGSGATAAVLMVEQGRLWLVNLGDSRLLLCRSGAVWEPSLLHKPTSRAERARIEASGGWVSDGGRVHGVLAVSRAFGDPELKQLAPYVTASPDTRAVALAADVEFALLCSDGVTDVLSPQAAVTVVKSTLRERACAQAAAEVVVTEAMRRQSLDNATAVVVCFHQTVDPDAEGPAWNDATPQTSSAPTPRTAEPQKPVPVGSDSAVVGACAGRWVSNTEGGSERGGGAGCGEGGGGGSERGGGAGCGEAGECKFVRGGCGCGCGAELRRHGVY